MRSKPWLGRAFQTSAWLVSSVLFFIVFFLVVESAELINEIGILRLFQDARWNPTESHFRLTPMILGSLSVAGGAILLAAPLGIATALYSQFYASKPFARLYRGLMELLAGIPSVVFGLWGLVVLVPWIAGWAPPGASVLAGILVLALMILPLVALTSDEALKRVPVSYINSAKAMGLSQWGTIRKVALPVAMPGILSGIILQTGRALGETMAILMVCGNVVQVPSSWFQPVRTLTANIALEMAYAVDQHRAALFVSGLLLLLVTVGLFVAVSAATRTNTQTFKSSE